MSEFSFLSRCWRGVAARARAITLTSLVMVSLLSSLVLSACGEQNDKVYTVGIFVDSASFIPRFTGLKDGLKALGYIEGKNVKFDVLDSSAMTKDDQEAALKAFTGRTHSAIWTGSGTTTTIIKPYLSKQPVVAAGLSDAVALGFAQSLERPGGTITGVDSLNNELTVKRMGWLVKQDPSIRQVYLLYEAKNNVQLSYLPAIRSEAARLNLTLLERPVNSKEASKAVIAGFKGSEAQGVLTVGNSPMARGLDLQELKKTVEREKLVLVGGSRDHLEVGALMSYGPNDVLLGKQSARVLVQILNGANPAEVPIVPVDKIELLLNQKLADQFSRTFSEVVSTSADEIVK